MKRTLHERVTTTFRGQRFVFRVPHLGDLVALDKALPVPEIDGLDELKTPNEAWNALARTPDRLERVLARHSKLLCLTAIDPPIVDGNAGAVPDEAFDVREIPGQTVLQLGMLLLDRSRLEEGEVLTLRPFSEGDGEASASNSTASRADTARSPVVASSAGVGAG